MSLQEIPDHPGPSSGASFGCDACAGVLPVDLLCHVARALKGGPMLRNLLIVLGLLVGWTGAWAAWAASPTPPRHEGDFQAHVNNYVGFNTPIVTDPAGSIYVCYTDPQLRTVVVRKDSQTGVWSAPTSLTDTTGTDVYHIRCSLGIDRHGFLHAVYNMHSTPWQYKVSTIPYSVAAFVFRGQEAGTAGKSIPKEAGCTGECEANWYRTEPGIAAIPGNQITYPHFGTDSQRDLYLAFRECFYCERAYHDRQWSSSIAKYDVTTQTWARVGNVRPWATEAGKLAYALRLFGDPFGRLHASFLWCPPYTQAEGGHACMAYPNFVSYAWSGDGGAHWHRTDGTTLTLPLTSAASEVVSGPEWFDQHGVPGYYKSDTTVLASLKQASKPFVTVYAYTPDSTKGVPARAPVVYQALHWTPPLTTMGYSPYLTYEDPQGRWKAVSSGIRVHTSTDQGQTWTIQEVDIARGPFHLTYDAPYLLATHRLRLYAHNQQTGLLTIWTMPTD